jgi:hypothetical protein
MMIPQLALILLSQQVNKIKFNLFLLEFLFLWVWFIYYNRE